MDGVFLLECSLGVALELTDFENTGGGGGAACKVVFGRRCPKTKTASAKLHPTTKVLIFIATRRDQRLTGFEVSLTDQML